MKKTSLRDLTEQALDAIVTKAGNARSSAYWQRGRAMIRLSQLEAMAKQVPADPWLVRHYPDCLPLIKMPTDELQEIPTRELADYIAAFSPQTVLKLIAVVRAAQQAHEYGDGSGMHDLGRALMELNHSHP